MGDNFPTHGYGRYRRIPVVGFTYDGTNLGELRKIMTDNGWIQTHNTWGDEPMFYKGYLVRTFYPGETVLLDGNMTTLKADDLRVLYDVV